VGDLRIFLPKTCQSEGIAPLAELPIEGRFDPMDILLWSVEPFMSLVPVRSCPAAVLAFQARSLVILPLPKKIGRTGLLQEESLHPPRRRGSRLASAWHPGGCFGSRVGRARTEKERI
jgi:hypothetical protein